MGIEMCLGMLIDVCALLLSVLHTIVECVHVCVCLGRCINGEGDVRGIVEVCRCWRVVTYAWVEYAIKWSQGKIKKEKKQ